MTLKGFILVASLLVSASLYASTFYAMRHGESVPSLEKRVCATMASGCDAKNGLTAKGRGEVTQSATDWISANRAMLSDRLERDAPVIVSSPFSRAKETAEILAELIFTKLGKRSAVVIENDLRERNFGEFEAKNNSDKIYEQVWVEDRKNPRHTRWEVESANAVQERTRRVVKRLQGQSPGQDDRVFILVAHGDTLKILQTAFQNLSASEHANPKLVAPFSTAEIRYFGLHSCGQECENAIHPSDD
jgi:probable phosphoglycerate mutase